MMVAADAALGERDSACIARWTLCLLLVLAAHAAVALFLLSIQIEPRLPLTPPPAVFLELAPLPTIASASVAPQPAREPQVQPALLPPVLQLEARLLPPVSELAFIPETAPPPDPEPVPISEPEPTPEQPEPSEVRQPPPEPSPAPAPVVTLPIPLPKPKPVATQTQTAAKPASD